MNYVPVIVAGTSSTNILGTKEYVHQAVKEKESPLRLIALPNWFHEAQITSSNAVASKDDAIPVNNALQQEQQEVNRDKEVPKSSGNSNPTASIKVSTNDSFKLALSSTVETEVPTANTPVPTDSLSVPSVTSNVPRIIFKRGPSFLEPLSLGNAMAFKKRLEDFFRDTSNAVSLNEVEVDLSNTETAIQVSLTLILRIHKVHPKSQIIGPVDTVVQTRQKTKNKIEENLHVDFLENKSIEKGTRPDWLFNIDTLANSMNYVPVIVAGTSSTNILGTKEDVHQAVKEKESPLRLIALPNWFHKAQITSSNAVASKDDAILVNNAPQQEQQEGRIKLPRATIFRKCYGIQEKKRLCMDFIKLLELGMVLCLSERKQKKDKIGSKLDKNKKRGKAGKSQKQLQWIKNEKLKKMQKEGPEMHNPTKFIRRKKEQGLNLQFTERYTERDLNCLHYKVVSHGTSCANNIYQFRG
nr:hypothetical protein [Tanacetum cinerariifolium]